MHEYTIHVCSLLLPLRAEWNLRKWNLEMGFQFFYSRRTQLAAQGKGDEEGTTGSVARYGPATQRQQETCIVCHILASGPIHVALFLDRWILNMDGASTYLSDLLFTHVECPRVRSGAGWMLPDKPAVFLTSAKETPPLFPPLSIPRSLRDGRSPAPHPPSAERQLLHKQL
jgi:hypothetical protein